MFYFFITHQIASLQALKCIVEAVTRDTPMETSNPDDLQELIELITKGWSIEPPVHSSIQ